MSPLIPDPQPLESGPPLMPRRAADAESAELSVKRCVEFYGWPMFLNAIAEKGHKIYIECAADQNRRDEAHCWDEFSQYVVDFISDLGKIAEADERTQDGI